MWRVYAFEMDASADTYIPTDAIAISEEEAKELAQLPPTLELQKAQEESVAALGGRGWSRYPTKEFKEALGHICVNSAHIEVTIRTIIWHVAGVSAEVGMTLTGGKQAFRELQETLTALIKLRYPHLLIDVAPVLKRLDSLIASRNRYVHGIWHPGENNKATVSKHFLKRSHAEGNASETTVSLDELYEVAEGFMKIESELLTKILAPLDDSLYPPQEKAARGKTKKDASLK